MKSNTAQQYVQLRNALTSEKAAIEQRLQQITEALGSGKTMPEPIESLPASQSADLRGRGRGGNTVTLKEAILRATSGVPLNRKEIFEAVQKLGYVFQSKNPLNLIGSVIYGKNPRFKNENGRYSPIGNAVDRR